MPEIARYLTGWHTGIVVEHGDRPIGAAWLRSFDERDPGYGFVDAAVPELTIGVVDAHRGRGAGTLLLRALLRRADAAHDAVSLSVEDGNPAVHLYERLGFETAAHDGSARTMVRRASL